MEIVSRGVFGTRSAVLRLRRKDTALQFVIFPMLHVASQRFYDDVTSRLRGCQVVVVEGVAGRSVLTWAITLSYRVIPMNRRSGLVVQNLPYADLGIPVIRPDVSAAEFARGWRTLPLTTRLMVWCVLPFVVVVQLCGGRRALLAPSVEVNDDDLPEDEVDEQFHRVFRGERDRRLLAALTELHHTRSHERIDVAIVYGAAHVGDLVHALAAGLGYRPRSADWLTVLDA